MADSSASSREKAGIRARSRAKFGREPSASAVNATYQRNVARRKGARAPRPPMTALKQAPSPMPGTKAPAPSRPPVVAPGGPGGLKSGPPAAPLGKVPPGWSQGRKTGWAGKATPPAPAGRQEPPGALKPGKRPAAPKPGLMPRPPKRSAAVSS